MKKLQTKPKTKQIKYQIDQSGKIEQTNKDTIVALSNDHNLAIMVKAKTKRIIQTWFREEKRQRFFPYLTFAALLAILIKMESPKSRVEIDKEYFGNEDLILERVTIYLKLLGIEKHPPLEWGHVGKTSKAHDYGAKMAKNKSKINKVISLEEVMEILLELKGSKK